MGRSSPNSRFPELHPPRALLKGASGVHLSGCGHVSLLGGVPWSQSQGQLRDQLECVDRSAGSLILERQERLQVCAPMLPPERQESRAARLHWGILRPVGKGLQWSLRPLKRR